jgi:hypothetical protein
MGRTFLAVLVGVVSACGGATPYPAVGSVVNDARADQLAFASRYEKKGLAFRGTVQKKGVKASTATGFDFTAQGLGGHQAAGGVVVSGTSRRVNVNYGYAFIGNGADEGTRALCLFDPESLSEAAALQVGQAATVTCSFSKFVGDPQHPTPVFWGCSVIE